MSLIPDQPPGTAIFIILVAIVINILTNLVSLKFVDTKRLKIYKRTQREFNSLKMKVAREPDKRLARKLELLEKEMSRKSINKELSSMQFKPVLITFIPLLLVFVLMNDMFFSKVVAVVPFSLPETLIIIPLGKNFVSNGYNYFRFSYIGWYFAVSISIGGVIRKLAKLDPY